MSTTAKLIAATTIAMMAIVPSALRERTRVSPTGSDPSIRMLEGTAHDTSSPFRGFLELSATHPGREAAPGPAARRPRVARGAAACFDYPQWTP
ncbi:hypothetical protein GCM10025869_28100 [Homoserinibacter gongjuensis]|uniref:Uncharacterized protein n=1 Tax=Homoserinibacter gongjuensis TaxID=1162968 RepID=A0ABQ6JXP8_9MICO|nr:hypothetical protein GCM10025869_28100 [Homoserinibacter gongjuensis]